MRMGYALFVLLLTCSLGHSNSHTSSGAEPETWIEVQAHSSEYINASGPKIVLIGRIATGGGRAHIQIGHPWLPVDELREYQNSFHALRGDRELQDLRQLEVLIKGKPTKDPTQDNWPLIMVGWMRELRPDDSDWSMPWQVNLPLLSMTKDKDAISHIVACRAVSDADSQLGPSAVHHANQTFEVQESLYGDEPIGKTVVLRYSYLAGRGRDVEKGERTIWMLTKSNYSKHLIGYGAVPDTPNNRLKVIELTNQLKDSHQERVQQESRADSASRSNTD